MLILGLLLAYIIIGMPIQSAIERRKRRPVVARRPAGPVRSYDQYFLDTHGIAPLD